MSISGTEVREALARSVTVSDEALIADLTDGRTIAWALSWFPRLSHGTSAQPANWRLIAGGAGIHWPDLDDDISAEVFWRADDRARSGGLAAMAAGAQSRISEDRNADTCVSQQARTC
jgi:hypothetical protein